MKEKNNAICSICGKDYYMCLACKDIMNLNPWKKHTCTSEHYKIYQILHGFNTKVYTKDEARSRLQMVDLSDINNLRDNIKNIINEIINDDENVVKESCESVDLLNEISVSDEYINDTHYEDNIVVAKAKTIRKRKSSEILETE